MVNGMMQENINMLVQKIQSMSGGSTVGSHTHTNSTDTRDMIDEKHEDIDPLHNISEPTSEATASATSTNELEEDLEVGAVKRRPTILINACTVALTIALVMTLIGLGCQELAQEVATDGNYLRLLLLITAPLQIFVSLVSHPTNPHTYGYVYSCFSSPPVLLSVSDEHYCSTSRSRQPNEAEL